MFSSGEFTTPLPLRADELETIFVSPRLLRAALARVVRDRLAGLSAVHGALCGGLAVVLQMTVPNAERWLVLVCLGFALLLWLGGVIASRVRVPWASADGLACLVALSASACTLIAAAVTGESLLLLPLLVHVTAASAVLIDRRCFVALLLAVVGGWLFVGYRILFLSEWPLHAFALICAVSLGTWGYSARASTLRRLMKLHLQERGRKRLLEERVDDAFRSSVELREMTVRDPLTGAYNRRYLSSVRSGLEVADARWGVILVDLDGFKDINDRLGHEAGDRTLQKMAHFVRRQARAEDRLIRFGGDEFLLILRAEQPEEVHRVAQRLREAAVREAPAPFSLGAVHRHPGESLKSLLQRADEAMYADKRRDHHYEGVANGRRSVG